MILRKIRMAENFWNFHTVYQRIMWTNENMYYVGHKDETHEQKIPFSMFPVWGNIGFC